MRIGLDQNLYSSSRYSELQRSGQTNYIPDISMKETETAFVKEEPKEDSWQVAEKEDRQSREQEQRTNANPKSVAESFVYMNDLELLGRDSDLFGLDTEQAVSDMKKDSILRDYQYFVGSEFQNREVFSSDDGSVLLKGNTL